LLPPFLQGNVVLRTGFRALLLSGLALLPACAGERPAPAGAAAPALRIERAPAPGGTRLLLVTRPGTRINAGTPPALELLDGTVVQFDTSAVTPDSLYYAAPPAALLRAGTDPRGTLRASVCDEGALVCRQVQVEI
jgi:hypothetical protein